MDARERAEYPRGEPDESGPAQMLHNLHYRKRRTAAQDPFLRPIVVLVARLRGSGNTTLTTDEIMALTRGE